MCTLINTRIHISFKGIHYNWLHLLPERKWDYAESLYKMYLPDVALLFCHGAK